MHENERLRHYLLVSREVYNWLWVARPNEIWKLRWWTMKSFIHCIFDVGGTHIIKITLIHYFFTVNLRYLSLAFSFSTTCDPLKSFKKIENEKNTLLRILPILYWISGYQLRLPIVSVGKWQSSWEFGLVSLCNAAVARNCGGPVERSIALTEFWMGPCGFYTVIFKYSATSHADCKVHTPQQLRVYGTCTTNLTMGRLD